MSSEKEKKLEKLNNEETLEISGGNNIPPKEEHVYVCHRPSFKHPIAMKYGMRKPGENMIAVDYGAPMPIDTETEQDDDLKE